ncbi:acyl-CoA thioesterase [Peptoniphilus catoniae]|uniref:acyl-CoA thioesterase n=1 Tax=Peptoniphilus catoniae TaxID=1660341 RepID=UPI0010FE0758|nr:acyl-CoA thioesterase [Peptoniphilus catoniae]
METDIRTNIKIKKTSESRVSFTHATLPTDLNEGGSLYGARLLEWADNLSAVVAIKHRRGWVTTVGFNNFNFIKAIHLGDFIYGKAFISGVGKSSMEIFVKFVGEDSVSGERYLAATGFITYAALKLKEGESLPQIEGETEEEIKIISGYSDRKKEDLKRISENRRLISRIDLYEI